MGTDNTVYFWSRNVLHLKRSYDNIAFFYNRLSRLVYGNTLVNAQQYLVRAIPAYTRILIIGGGTGWLLEEIIKIHSSGLNITYIDASAKMIALAQRCSVGENKVTFIVASIEDWVTTDVYDVVITPFLFDNFTDNSLRKIFSSIDNHIKVDGIWLYCDFRKTDVFWQKALLNVMYIFFKVSCGIEAKQLPDADICFAQHGYHLIAQKIFMNGFVASIIYKKQ